MNTDKLAACLHRYGLHAMSLTVPTQQTSATSAIGVNELQGLLICASVSGVALYNLLQGPSRCVPYHLS